MSKKFLMNWTFLTAASLNAGCAYNPKHLTPEFIDVQKGVCREYHVTQSKPEIIFAFTKEKPLSECNGHVAFPVEQAQEMKRYYENWVKHKNDSVQNEEKPENEIDVINGIPNPCQNGESCPQ